MFCLYCGAPLGEGDQVCPVCGSVANATGAQGQAGPICTNCGAPLEEGDSFCVECGTPVLAAAEPERTCCPRCGAPIEADDAFCVECGSPLQSPSGPAEILAPAYADFVDDVQPAVTTKAEAMTSAPEHQRSIPQTREETIEDKSPSPSPYIDEARVAAQVEAPATTSTSADGATSKHIPVPAIAAIAAAIVIVALALLLAPKLFSGNQQGQPASQPPAAEESSQQDEVAKEAVPEGGIEVRESVDEYSWAELSAISDEIEAAGGDLEAMQVARHYNLCDPDGKLDGSQAKRIELADGTSTTVQIVGFRHDKKASDGAAGISFLFTEAISIRPMNADGSSHGGWESTDLRRWLSESFYDELSPDLRNAIVAVEKKTNNAGQTTDLDSVTKTKDKLWLPSAKELCGNVKWATGQKAKNGANKILNREGEQYQLFQDIGIYDNSGNSILERFTTSGDSTEWWMRSTRSSVADYFYYVDDIGMPHNYEGEANDIRGIVPGFCI